MHQCEVCGIEVSRKNSLNRHLLRCHNIDNRREYRNQCLECKVSFSTRKALREHLLAHHGVQPDVEKFTFSSKAELDAWIENMPISHQSEYIKHNVLINGTSGEEVSYYECSRSSVPDKKKPKIEGRKRQLKSTGSKRMLINCTSQIIVTKKASRQYEARFFKRHYGHALEMKHLHLPKTVRREVEMQLLNRVPPSSILDFFRDSASESFTRGDFINKQDITNIATASHVPLNDGVRHKNDAESVDKWVEESKFKGDDNPIIFYKKQGDELENFQCQDFIMIIMTGQQKKMLKDFGGGIISIDSTHGLNNYNFLMSALMVVDEFGEGYPVSYMFSNREDTKVFELYFRVLKEKVGVISPVTFMTDITHVFYNAWNNIMGPVKNQIYCSWHVDKAFQRNLKKIKNEEKRAKVYKALKVIQMMVDVDKFKRNFQTFLQQLEEDNDTKDFYHYLYDNYSGNVKKWAYCYRKGCGVNTNMRLENLFKLLKHNYLKGNIVKRLDKGINSLMKLTRDKFFDRERKLTMGKNNSHTKKLSERHARGESMEVRCENEQYIVNNKYRVKPKEEHVCCSLKCIPCDICVSCYSCPCEDYGLNFSICSHIHAVANSKRQNMSSVPLSQEEIERTRNISCDESRMCETGDFIKKEEVCVKKINERTALVMETLADTEGQTKIDFLCEWENYLRVLHARIVMAKKTKVSEEKGVKPDRELEVTNVQGATHFQPITVSNEVEVVTAPSITKQSSEPGNKKIKKQLRFYSTKKKTTTVKRNFKKPSRSEVAEIIDVLNDNRFFVSSSSSYDHAYTVLDKDRVGNDPGLIQSRESQTSAFTGDIISEGRGPPNI